MMEQDLLNVIGSYGFPIAVTVYLLYERSRGIKELTRAITSLTILIKTKVK